MKFDVTSVLVCHDTIAESMRMTSTLLLWCLHAEGQVPLENNTGTNTYVYFVCNYLGGPMTQLPYVTPDQIKAARLIKKFLTGRLTSHVSTYPLFPGNEANFLRAQIARIAASTVCAPSGLFAANDDGSLERSEEYAGFPGRELSQTANWVHR